MGGAARRSRSLYRRPPFPDVETSSVSTMKTSFWIAGLLATLLQLAGLLCGSYGVLRESFTNLAQPRGFGEGRFGEGTFGGTPTRLEQALITLGTITRLLPTDNTLTVTDRKSNAAWAIAGVLLALIGTIIDFVLKFASR
jgi:hypothetical protein